jgi:type II secretion system protein D
LNIAQVGKSWVIFGLVCISVFLLGLWPAKAQPTISSPQEGDDPIVQFQAVNADLPTILQEYEQLTGKTLIEDSNLLTNAAPITISVPDQVRRSQVIRLIEAALLLNNYALIPGPSTNSVKVINLNTGKNPRSEGVRLYTMPESLPEGDQIVSYYMALSHISAAEALTVFQTHILPRAYSSFVPVNSAQAILITESTSVIRQLIALRDLIDVPPAATSTEFVQLVRADAEKVCDTLNKLLDQHKEAATQPVTPGNPVAITPAASGYTGITGLQGQLIPDARTNRVLIVARTENLVKLKDLVLSLDRPSLVSAPLEYRLHYLSAGEVLPVLANLLSEGNEQQQANTNNPAGGPSPTQQNRTVNLNPSSSNTNSYSGGYSSSSSSAGSTGAGEDLLQEPNEQLGPQSVIVGKTRIISDAKDNKIVVIGPPESIQKVRDLLDKLDRRPQQVYLSTVIGQLSLINETDFGVDFTQTYKKINDSAGVASANLNSGFINSSGTGVVSPRTLLTSGLIPGTEGLAIYANITDAISAFVKALDTRSKFTILARPAVYTANNKRAVIASGQRVPVPGQTLTNANSITNNTASIASTIEYQDVELRLEVIPLINSNREVTLKIEQIDDTLCKHVLITGTSVPEINSQRLTTTVTVPSGATVVLGGLIQDQIKHTENGIPIVDRLPYIGNLFKFQTHNRTRNELLIFIQPTVVESNVEAYHASVKEEQRTKVGSQSAILAHLTSMLRRSRTPRRAICGRQVGAVGQRIVGTEESRPAVSGQWPETLSRATDVHGTPV